MTNTESHSAVNRVISEEEKKKQQKKQGSRLQCKVCRNWPTFGLGPTPSWGGFWRLTAPSLRRKWMGSWDHKLPHSPRPTYDPPSTWNMPTGHQPNSSLCLGNLNISVPSRSLEPAYGESGEGRGGGWAEGAACCCGQGAGPESPSIFSRAWPAQATAAGPLAPGPRRVYSGIFLLALGMGAHLARASPLT